MNNGLAEINRRVYASHEDPKPVLKPGVIYSSDNGRRICVECAGASAKYTGRDISGMRVQRIPKIDAVEWFDVFHKALACEEGCTAYPLPKLKKLADDVRCQAGRLSMAYAMGKDSARCPEKATHKTQGGTKMCAQHLGFDGGKPLKPT